MVVKSGWILLLPYACFYLFPLPVIEFLQGHRQRVLEGIKMFSRLAKPSAISCVIRRSFSSSTQVWYIFKNEILHDLKYLNTARVKITLLKLQWTWSFIYNYKYFLLMQLGCKNCLPFQDTWVHSLVIIGVVLFSLIFSAQYFVGYWPLTLSFFCWSFLNFIVCFSIYTSRLITKYVIKAFLYIWGNCNGHC